jgi:hypothetical protein
MREVVHPTWGLRNQLLKKHKTLKFRERCVLKLEKVAMAIIVRIHLTSIVACFYTLETFLRYSSSILGYISIILAISRQMYEKRKQHFLILILKNDNIQQFPL